MTESVRTRIRTLCLNFAKSSSFRVPEASSRAVRVRFSKVLEVHRYQWEMSSFSNQMLWKFCPKIPLSGTSLPLLNEAVNFAGCYIVFFQKKNLSVNETRLGVYSWFCNWFMTWSWSNTYDLNLSFPISKIEKMFDVVHNYHWHSWYHLHSS